MGIEFGLTKELVNTKYGPLAALWVHYGHGETLKPLENVAIPIKTRDYSPASKLNQVLLSILAGCEHLSEVNVKLKPERALAQVCGLESFSDQSNLSRTLDGLTLMNLAQLQGAVRHIWQQHSRTLTHDWRGFLWLDYDLSGLPCGKQAEKSQKGFFSGKKTSAAANWRGSVPSNITKPSGRTCLPVISIRSTVCNRLCWPRKVH